jgi:hypothetical protein
MFWAIDATTKGGGEAEEVWGSHRNLCDDFHQKSQLVIWKNFNGRPFFSLFFVARANQKIRILALGRESRNFGLLTQI